MSKAKVLLVEDNKLQADIIREFLSRNGYEVVTVDNGVAAFKAAQMHHVDIVLLDRILPDMDGGDVCRWLKIDPNTRDIPIIMLTAKAGLDDKISGLEAGADDYLPKPFEESELNARIFVRLRSKAHEDELKQKNRQLEDMLMRVESLAIMDPLTGLYNRRRFEAILSTEFKRSHRYNNPLSCLVIDVDHFKKINDTHGHQTGDAVLKECAQVIQNTIREVDTAARWGGEEFIILVPNTSKENGKRAAERIWKAVGGHAFAVLPGVQVTVSIGVAGIPDPAIQTTEQLIHTADVAMYEAKKKGRNRVESS